MIDLTPKQQEIFKLLSSNSGYYHIYGSSGSGKTFAIMYYLVNLCLQFSNANVLCIRKFQANAVEKLQNDTLNEILSMTRLSKVCKNNSVRHTTEFNNGSKITYVGVSTPEHLQKALGYSNTVIYFNECTEIQYNEYETFLTRLRKPVQKGNKKIVPFTITDCNPTSTNHWSCRLFVQKKNPNNGNDIVSPEKYHYLQCKAEDNTFLSQDYINSLKMLSHELRERFYIGEYSEYSDFALFRQETLDNHTTQDIDDSIERIVISVDPALGTSIGSDESGICVFAKGKSGMIYVLEDFTQLCNIQKLVEIIKRLHQDYSYKFPCEVVVESNGCGELAIQMIQQVGINPIGVHSHVGKLVRAEPIAIAVSQGKVTFLKYFRKLFNQLTTYIGGSESPNAMDAFTQGVQYLLGSQSRAAFCSFRM